MPAPNRLYQEVFQRIFAATRRHRVRKSTVTRLALLVTGILGAKSCVLQQVATELWGMGLTRATQEESIVRRLTRTLTDPRLAAATCYTPALTQVLDWAHLLRGRQEVVLIVDESTKAAQVHLLRVGLAYWGGSLPLAWATWAQNVPQPPAHYWTEVQQVLSQAQALLPAGLAVLVLADRAFEVPRFVDLVAARGWHWAVRCKANSDVRFRDLRGREHCLRDLVRQHVPRPGRRWKARGHVWKDAGWRPASVVAVWGAGYQEPLVVLTDLPPRWAAIPAYAMRCWIEPGFRTDKTAGWQWEACQVPDPARHQRLLVALAWATLVRLCQGIQRATQRLAQAAQRYRQRRPRSGRPQHARQSVFRLGQGAVCRLLYQPAGWQPRWRLPELDAPSFNVQYQRAQVQRFIFL